MNDEYEILGLKPNATNEEVKKAYQKLSMVYHPDKGGDNDHFVRIKKAYENIMFGGVGPDNLRAAALTDLAGLFLTVVDKCETQPHTIDLVKRVRQLITDTMLEIMKQETQQRANRDIYKKLQGRIKSKTKLNIFESALNIRIQEIDNKITECEKAYNKGELMKEILNDYSFEQADIMDGYSFIENYSGI